MADQTTKNYPLATTEAAQMLGFNSPQDDQSVSHAQTGSVHAPAGHQAPVGLPVIQPDIPAHSNPTPEQQQRLDSQKRLNKLKEEVFDNPMQIGSEEPTKRLPVGPLLKLIGPYLLIFLIGIFLYFFFFSNVNFASWFQSQQSKQSSQATALQQLEKKNLGSYNKWINNYYYGVSSAAVIDPDADNSGNGLTNFQKYLLDLNPTSYDTLGMGMPDSQVLADGINPSTGMPLNDQQKQILSKYFDMETIMDKLSQEQMTQQTNGITAGIQSNPVSGTTIVQNDNLPTSFAANQATSTRQFGDNVLHENLDINQSVPGELDVPGMDVHAPLTFSTSANNFDNDLKNGVIHYPGTALPGEIGNSYIAGHSSNYVWVKSNYNHIFTHLDELKTGDSFSITVTLNNGQKVTLHYQVTGSKQYSPTDPAQVANTGQSTVSLSTCWPVDTTQKRLVVTGVLTQIDQ